MSWTPGLDAIWSQQRMMHTCVLSHETGRTLFTSPMKYSMCMSCTGNRFRAAMAYSCRQTLYLLSAIMIAAECDGGTRVLPVVVLWIETFVWKKPEWPA